MATISEFFAAAAAVHETAAFAAAPPVKVLRLTLSRRCSRDGRLGSGCSCSRQGSSWTLHAWPFQWSRRGLQGLKTFLHGHGLGRACSKGSFQSPSACTLHEAPRPRRPGAGAWSTGCIRRDQSQMLNSFAGPLQLQEVSFDLSLIVRQQLGILVSPACSRHGFAIRVF